jgi:hypothetical protein
MASAARQYARELGRQFRFLATWTPAVRVALGDIGTIDDDNLFVRVASLADFGISFDETVEQGASETFDYASAGAVKIGFKAAGSPSALVPNVPIATAGLGIHFSREHATVFRADGATHSRIANEIRLVEDVAWLMREHRWDRNWSIVNHVVQAESTSVLLAQSAGASIEFGLSAKVTGGGLELLNADVGLQTVASREMQFSIVGIGNSTPLFRAKRVRRRWFVGQPQLRAAYSDDFARREASAEDDDLFEDTPIYNGVDTTTQDSPDGESTGISQQ